MTSKRRNIITALCILGLILSIDLVYIYIKINFMQDAPKSFCSISEFVDCDGVARTPKAFFLGVPLAIWGVILYLLFLFLAWVDVIKKKIKFPLLDVFKNPTSYIASIGLLSFGISIILATISISVIHKICILCFCTYFVNLFIAIAAVKKDFFITDIKNTVLDFIQGVKEHLTLFLLVATATVCALTYFETSYILAPNLRANKSIQEFVKLKNNIYAIDGNMLGNPDGDVEIYVYGDFQCPFCKVMNVMLHKLVKEDKGIAVYHVNYPLDKECNPTVRQDVHRNSCLLARYALAAKDQGNYWGMVSMLYDMQPKSEKSMVAAGKAVGLDEVKLQQDANSDKIKEDLENQIYRGIAESLYATPTVIIDDIPHIDAVSYYRLKELVKQSRARHARAK